ncbi:MAG: hypothetical protein Q4C50_12510 [Eubacteriales bacterium]|nr:hypothetical protein [Eubacteriales bacterium]
MEYLGMEFKNHEELINWSKEGNIEEYKKLARMFDQNSTMELSIMMGKRADVLHNRFNMSWEEIEKLEIEAIA